MTVANVYTFAFQGIEAREVAVQVHVGDSGGGQFNIVGLADLAGETKVAKPHIAEALSYRRLTHLA